MYFSNPQYCPDCGGMVAWSATECRYCQSEINFSTRLHWAGEWGQLGLVAVALFFGGLLGVIFSVAPKADPVTALSATIFLWYVQRMFQPRAVAIRA